MKELFQIFICFIKIGALTFGGGYSMLPMLQKELVEKHMWLKEEEILDFYAIAQCLPGLIAVNMAAMTGCRIKGVRGGAAAALGVVFPSYVIIVVIAAFIQNFISNPIMQNAFFGIRIAVSALIADAIIKLWKSGVRNVVTFFIFAAAFMISILWSVPSVYIVLFAIASGILLSGKKWRNGNRNGMDNKTETETEKEKRNEAKQ